LRLLAFALLALAYAGLPGGLIAAEGATQQLPALAAASAEANVAEALRSLLLAPEPLQDTIDERSLRLLADLYKDRDYRPIWIGTTETPLQFLALLRRLREGAGIADPSLATLVDRAASAAERRDPEGLAELELAVSTMLARLAADPDAPIELPADGAQILRLAASASDPKAFLRLHLPTDPAFWRLRMAARPYQEWSASGGWPLLSDGPTLHPGDQAVRILELRNRLAATGDLTAAGAVPARFDASLEADVRRFQERNGLAADGIVGKRTQAALNVTAAQRLATIEVNLKRLQREQRQWGDRYVAVNAAAATYVLVQDGTLLFERRSIVGRRDWPTPRIDGIIDRLEFNPYWVVPPRIARIELWPRIRRDPDYLARHDMTLVDGQIRQNPGPKNPLGVVKFHFDNPDFIYLHDTSNPELFERPDRFLSHGCVRIAGARELAALLLAPDPSWPADRIDAAIASGRNLEVPLPRPMPIHIVYDTAWVDATGGVQFRDDIYGRDRVATAQGAPESCSG